MALLAPPAERDATVPVFAAARDPPAWRLGTELLRLAPELLRLAPELFRLAPELLRLAPAPLPFARAPLPFAPRDFDVRLPLDFDEPRLAEPFRSESLVACAIRTSPPIKCDSTLRVPPGQPG